MLDRLGDEDVRGAVIAYRDALRAHRAYLNRLNVYPVPDGDTGTNMALTLESVVAEIDGVTGMADTCRAISHGSLMGARGNSGVILSQILRGLADGLRDADPVDGAAVANGLVKGSASAYEAVMRPVEGTILTVAKAAADAVAARRDASLVEVLDTAAGAARDALARTPELLPVLAEAGVVDAGGAGFVLLLDALLYVAAERPLPEPPEVPAHMGAATAESSAGAEGHGDDSDLRYEVMFLLEAPDDDIAGFKQVWAGMGDSIVVTGGDGLWNCHIHTNDVGGSIEAGVDVGRPRKIEVTDLTDMIEKERLVRGGHGDACAGHHAGAKEAVAGGGERTTAVVAVGTGDGIVRILRSLGVAAVVSGGQTMNPSTRDLLAAVEDTGADQVVLLPNNGNIIPVAQQVDALTATTVRVVETRSVAEGFAALLGYEPTGDAAGNAKAMAESAASVVTGEVTRAVRDANTVAGPCRQGDYLGVARDGIRVVAPTAVEAACGLLEAVVDEHHEMVTIIEGAPASAADTATIVEWLGDHRPQATAEVHPGDQPLSAYLFSVE